jgi:hypothetical protein
MLYQLAGGHCQPSGLGKRNQSLAVLHFPYSRTGHKISKERFVASVISNSILFLQPTSQQNPLSADQVRPSVLFVLLTLFSQKTSLKETQKNLKIPIKPQFRDRISSTRLTLTFPQSSTV